jgi:hypothetical protein
LTHYRGAIAEDLLTPPVAAYLGNRFPGAAPDRPA